LIRRGALEGLRTVATPQPTASATLPLAGEQRSLTVFSAPPVVSIPRNGGETKVVLKPHAHYSPARNPGIERLLDVGEKAGFEELEKIACVAEIDTECAMFKIRKLTERLCCVLLKPAAVDNLNDAITEIGKQKLLGKKVVAYLDQIRKVANLAVHGSDDLFDSKFSMSDVNIAADALACVIDEAISRSLIQRKRESLRLAKA
jgi:hypothetical protein